MTFTPFPAVVPPEVITDQPEKVTPVGPDELLIADSEAGAAAKKVQITNLLALAGGGVSSGSSVFHSGDTIPADSLESNGQTFDRTTETDLYTAIGEKYNLYDIEGKDTPKATASSFTGRGRSGVSISRDGTKIAFASRPIGATGQFVAVYDWDETSLTNKQVILAPSLVGALTSDPSVSLSSDGTVLAVGYLGTTVGGFTFCGTLFIYKLVASVWTLDATKPCPFPQASATYGQNVSISGDGLRIAVCSSKNQLDIYLDAGGGTWNVEQNIALAGGVFGRAVNLNSDGSVLATSDRNANTNTGKIYIYKRVVATWSQDQDLSGVMTSTAANYNIGEQGSFKLSDDGLSISVGNAGTGINKWWLLTSNGTAFSEVAVSSVSLADIGSAYFSALISGDGKNILVGLAGSDTGGVDAGAIVMFRYDKGVVYEDIVVGSDSPVAGDFFSISSEIATNGISIAVAASHADIGAANSGSGFGKSGLARVPTLTTGVNGSVYITKK